MYEELDRELLLKKSSNILPSIQDDDHVSLQHEERIQEEGLHLLAPHAEKKTHKKPKQPIPPKKKGLTKKQRTELEANIEYNMHHIRKEMKEILDQALKIETELIELKERGGIVKEFVEEEVKVYQKYKQPI
jgi:hypothetical protein